MFNLAFAVNSGQIKNALNFGKGYRKYDLSIMKYREWRDKKHYDALVLSIKKPVGF